MARKQVLISPHVFVNLYELISLQISRCKFHRVCSVPIKLIHQQCACDIPSHAYTYQFALNPDWPRFFSYSPDIWKYLDKVCNTFDLRKYMTFKTEVIGTYWNEENGEWTVKLRQTGPGQEPREFEDTCHLLLHGYENSGE